MIRNLLGFSGLYALFGKIISRNKADFFYNHEAGIKVLDVGCGPASRTHYFLDTDYIGIDISQEYIETATTKYQNHDNIKFFCADASIFLDPDNGLLQTFDLIFMCGVLHHLDDETASNVLSSISKLLSYNGEFRSIDGVYIDNQSRFAKWMLNNDRGKFVRSVYEYETLICSNFHENTYDIRHDLLRVPYTHIIFSSKIGISQLD